MNPNTLVSFAVVLLAVGISAAEDDLRDRLKDANGIRDDVWVYNDIGQAIRVAKQNNRPIFVTFRCVPCRDCAAFDADVAVGNGQIRKLAQEKFVSVRQVEMKGVDLSLFQFDFDLNWAGIFLNSDGVIYARYGTQSAEGSDAYNSVESLLLTMERVLELHARYPGNLAELKAKRGESRSISNPLELPGLRNPEKYAKQTERSNCIHCHNIHDAEHQHALEVGKYTAEMLWKYPLPENIGLKIDRKSGIRIDWVSTDSSASTAGLLAGEDIVRMNGQRITSIADMQWVLHHLPAGPTQVDIETSRTGPRSLFLNTGWKKVDFSWRGSMWNAPPRFEAWAPELNTETKEKLALPQSDSALEVRWINRQAKGGQKAFENGLRERDVIVALAGKPFTMNTRQFNVHLKMNYKVGEILPITILRNGERMDLKIELVE